MSNEQDANCAGKGFDFHALIEKAGELAKQFGMAGLKILPIGSFLVKNVAGGGVELVPVESQPCRCLGCRAMAFAETEASKVFEMKCEAYAAVWSATHEAHKLLALQNRTEAA